MDTAFNLQYPIDIDGTTVTVLQVRRPKVKDQKAALAAGKDPAAQEIALFSNLCDLSPSQMGELDMADYAGLQRLVQSFFTP